MRNLSHKNELLNQSVGGSHINGLALRLVLTRGKRQLGNGLLDKCRKRVK